MIYAGVGATEVVLGCSDECFQVGPATASEPAHSSVTGGKIGVKVKQQLWCILLGCQDCNLLPTHGFSIKPLKVSHF